MAQKRIHELETTQPHGYLASDTNDVTGKFPLDTIHENFAPLYDSTQAYSKYDWVNKDGVTLQANKDIAANAAFSDDDWDEKPLSSMTDNTYNASSKNPQSGVAVAQAVAAAIAQIGSPLVWKGTASVATLNGTITGLTNGWTYTLTDDGTLTAGNIQVHEGDEVAWTGSAWFQLGGSFISVDSALSSTSENPVQNKVIYAAIGNVEALLAAL